MGIQDKINWANRDPLEMAMVYLSNAEPASNLPPDDKSQWEEGRLVWLTAYAQKTGRIVTTKREQRK